MADHFHIPPEQWQPAALALTGDEARHCAQVMRKAVGDEIIVFNGRGDLARARITEVKKHIVRLDCLTTEHRAPPATRITLAAALIKADRWEWLLEKATELGATDIQPLRTERCVVRLGPDEAARKHDKWHRLLIEAAKQSRRAWLPVLHPAQSFHDWCASRPASDLSLIASLAPEARPLFQVITEFTTQHGRPAASALIAIGPEGDFTAEESALAHTSGLTPVNLGPHTLRAETAALCALSLLAASG